MLAMRLGQIQIDHLSDNARIVVVWPNDTIPGLAWRYRFGRTMKGPCCRDRFTGIPNPTLDLTDIGTGCGEDVPHVYLLGHGWFDANEMQPEDEREDILVIGGDWEPMVSTLITEVSEKRWGITGEVTHWMYIPEIDDETLKTAGVPRGETPKCWERFLD